WWASFHTAVEGGSARVQWALFDDGLEINCQSNDMAETLRSAVANAQSKVVRALLITNAAPNLGGPNGKQLLHLAASDGYQKAVRVLADRRADIETLDDEGRRPYMWLR